MKKLVPILIAAIFAGGIGFYGGLRYGQAKNSGGAGGQGNFQNLSAADRQARFGQMGFAGGRMGSSRQGAGFANGDVISQDDKSITIKLRDGGSKIIFVSSSTAISKFAAGTAHDLAVGTQVSVTGLANTDGSITAQTVQVRPAMVSPTQAVR